MCTHHTEVNQIIITVSRHLSLLKGYTNDPLGPLLICLIIHILVIQL